MEGSQPQHNSVKTSSGQMGTPQRLLAGGAESQMGMGWLSYPVLCSPMGWRQPGQLWIPRGTAGTVSQPSCLHRSLEGDLSNAPCWPLQSLITSAHSVRERTEASRDLPNCEAQNLSGLWQCYLGPTWTPFSTGSAILLSFFLWRQAMY